jgi:hypothetical protein
LRAVGRAAVAFDAAAWEWGVFASRHGAKAEGDPWYDDARRRFSDDMRREWDVLWTAYLAAREKLTTAARELANLMPHPARERFHPTVGTGEGCPCGPCKRHRAAGVRVAT